MLSQKMIELPSRQGNSAQAHGNRIMSTAEGNFLICDKCDTKFAINIYQMVSSN